MDNHNSKLEERRKQMSFTEIDIDVNNTEIELDHSVTTVSNCMTLILGARCIDGVVIAADRKFIGMGIDGVHYSYDDKITGELNGMLTAFAGDIGTFELFAWTLKDYASNTTKLQSDAKQEARGPSFDQLMLKISETQSNFYHKYEKYRCKIFMGISSIYFTNKISSLYYFEADGRCFPLTQAKAIGSGSPYASYFLKRYWRPNETTMEQFAQLSDFIIRYTSDPNLLLDNAVGLNDQDDKYRYPQLFYIPDKPDFCKIYNNDQPKTDCNPTVNRLIEFRRNSESTLKILHQIPNP